ncbi:hypothetical protein Sipo8835_32625 [Streptomyces ipomoeae]|uniref:Uncharacterized protein n=1 Tax=Streptomyces ipomoeae TaxID=103232 RepID=A0AAE8VXU2_9ACTN|nr:hypothetical protein [Streptomyces ipomoeae]TQE24860.1 hypothetical protein Sipo8835_32625 [Streptomyces ipomoeae]
MKVREAREKVLSTLRENQGGTEYGSFFEALPDLSLKAVPRLLGRMLDRGEIEVDSVYGCLILPGQPVDSHRLYRARA